MIELSHIGEHLIASMLNRSESAREALLGLDAWGEWLFVPEIPLNPLGNILFDGAHKIDVCALNMASSSCIPIEAKLGRERMSANQFAQRFLQAGGTSHQGKRITGSMIGILDGRLPPGLDRAELTVTHAGRRYSVQQNWILMVRDPIFNRWTNNGWPELSEHCTVKTIEQLVRAFGEPHDFNQFVLDLVSQDFHKMWFGL